MDIDVEQAMASKYRLSSMIPRNDLDCEEFESPSNITDKALLDYEKQFH